MYISLFSYFIYTPKLYLWMDVAFVFYIKAEFVSGRVCHPGHLVWVQNTVTRCPKQDLNSNQARRWPASCPLGWAGQLWVGVVNWVAMPR